MAFSTATIVAHTLGPNIDRSPLYDSLKTALAAGTSSISSLGGGDALARAVANLADFYRADRGLSAHAVLSVGASSTTSLLTLQIQIIPAA